MEQKQFSRVPSTLTDQRNYDLLSTNNSSLLVDFIVYLSDTQMQNLFGDNEFSIDDFCKKMGYERTNLQRKITSKERKN
jgi:hypothetical protein